MRSGRTFSLAICVVAALAACGGDDDSSSTTDAAREEVATDAPAAAETAAGGDAAEEPAGECPASDAEESRTITVRVDVTDDSGFGSIGTRIPSHLTPGPARLLVEVAADDEEPPVVTLSRDGAEVVTIDDVAPGTTCGADVDLEAGDYTITFLDKTKEFTVAAE